MERLRQFMLKNRVVSGVYNGKFYLNTGVAQISWFTGKLPEIMAFVYLTTWFGFELSRNAMFTFFVGAVVGLTLAGYMFKHLGLYDTECIVNNAKNPVTRDMLKAAQIIIKRDEENDD